MSRVSLEPCEVPAGELLLRPWTLADTPEIAEAAVDPEIIRWNRVGLPTPKEWCAKRADWSTGDHASWAVVSPNNRSRVMAAVSLHHLDLEQQNSEVGYWVGAEFRGRHLGARVLDIATRFGFERLQLRRIHLFHAIDNLASCAVANRAGFRQEGTHRQSYKFGDGLWHDEHSHARLNDDVIAPLS